MGVDGVVISFVVFSSVFSIIYDDLGKWMKFETRGKFEARRTSCTVQRELGPRNEEVRQFTDGHHILSGATVPSNQRPFFNVMPTALVSASLYD